MTSNFVADKAPSRQPRTVALIQSSYIPWKGYFDIIHDVDLFIFFDDVQFTARDWRTRNKVKTANGMVWLTVPAGAHVHRLICDVELSDNGWAQKHWKTLSQSYSRAAHFKKYKAFFEDIYLGRKWHSLSQLNQHLICEVSRHLLGISTEFRDSREYRAEGSKLDRLMDVIQKAGTDIYISGPSAKAYIDPQRFEAAGIQLVYKSYGGYPEYPQPHPPFEHGVTVLDLLFSVGPDAPYYIWGWRQDSR